jgi:hypothetical protein
MMGTGSSSASIETNIKAQEPAPMNVNTPAPMLPAPK